MELFDKQRLTERGLEYECSDAGNRDRFVRRHRSSLKYLIEDKAWIKWDGDRWTRDAKPLDAAIETANFIHDEARDCKVSTGKSELGRWAITSQSRNKLEAMLRLASEALGVSIKEFDTIPDEINCKNGVVDLRSGELKLHSPDQLVMKRANVDYDPNAKAVVWGKFLHDVFQGDGEMIDFMQRALGYSLTASVDEQIFFVLYGRGENGKGKLCETILKVMGDYSSPAQFDTFLATDQSSVRAMAAVGDLKGLRFALASETESAKKWSEALMKRLTGGDTLTGTRLFGSSYTFEPSHKLWFQANHLPSFKDGTHGFKRRLVVIPFERQFSGEHRDKDIAKKLWAEREGIFAWLVEGAKRYYDEGLKDRPRACQKATEDYINDNDVLGRFIRECLVEARGGHIAAQRLYERYAEWCRSEGQDAGSQNFFPRNMEERGVKKRRTSSGYVFDGYEFAIPGPKEAPKPDKSDPLYCPWDGYAANDKGEYEPIWRDLDRVA